MKVVVWIAVVILLGFLAVQLYNLYVSNAITRKELDKANAEVQVLSDENEQLMADIEYYAEPENLAKELKARFDYRKPGETLIKIQ